MTRLVFIDTETTSLRPDRRAWDVGMIVREDGKDTEHQFFVDTNDLDLGNADPFALRVGRFYERHPHMLPWESHRMDMVGSERAVMEQVEELTRDAHLIGAIVSFDAEVLAARMRARGILPSWRYHLIDVESLAIGYLRNSDKKMEPPWDAREFDAALGLKPAPAAEKHTAIGDARWAMRIYDEVMT